MTISNGDILKVTWMVILPGGQRGQNVYHLEAQLAAPQADLSVMAAVEVWIEDMYGEIDNAMSDAILQDLCSLDVVEWVTDKWVVTRNVGQFLPTVTYANVADPLPPMDSMFALFHTDRPKSNGRKFVPGICEDSQDNGLMNAGTLTAMGLYAAEVLAGINLGPLNDLVAGIVREGADVFLAFTLAEVTNLLMTQRRRRVGVGE